MSELEAAGPEGHLANPQEAKQGMRGRNKNRCATFMRRFVVYFRTALYIHHSPIREFAEKGTSEVVD
jgi:hypothetical protein